MIVCMYISKIVDHSSIYKPKERVGSEETRYCLTLASFPDLPSRDTL